MAFVHCYNRWTISHIVLRIWWGNGWQSRVYVWWDKGDGGNPTLGERTRKTNNHKRIRRKLKFGIHLNGLCLEQMFISRVLKLFVLLVPNWKKVVIFRVHSICSIETFHFPQFSNRSAFMKAQQNKQQSHWTLFFSRLFAICYNVYTSQWSKHTKSIQMGFLHWTYFVLVDLVRGILQV